ncbi:hypothetical protein AURDEDRAFT_175129 [Auricularia subglabra TFB-10046 SS5]|nr:hypothetical protein AURDEDRAFT_175129 [Auricularia subglabra TFB-10046 SS5]
MLLLLALAAGASAGLVNITVDDTYGDPQTGIAPGYTSLHAWNERTVADGCTSCGARPDGKQMYKETWHDETTFPGQIPSNMTFSFNGTMLYIYCVLANNVNLFHRDTRLAIYIDNLLSPVAQFLHTPDLGVDGFIYDQLVFKSDPLEDREHTVLVSNWADGDSGSLVLFDYAIYTMKEPDRLIPSQTTGHTPIPSSTPKHNDSTTAAKETPDTAPVHSTRNLGAIIGGSVAAVLAVLLLGAVAFWFLCWRQRSRSKSRPPVDLIMMDHDDERKGFIAAYPSTPGTPHGHFPSASASHESFHAADLKVVDEKTISPASANPLKRPLVVMAADPADAEKLGQGSGGTHLKEEFDRMRADIETIKLNVAPPRYNPY